MTQPNERSNTNTTNRRQLMMMPTVGPGALNLESMSTTDLLFGIPMITRGAFFGVPPAGWVMPEWARGVQGDFYGPARRAEEEAAKRAAEEEAAAFAAAGNVGDAAPSGSAQSVDMPVKSEGTVETASVSAASESVKGESARVIKKEEDTK